VNQRPPDVTRRATQVFLVAVIACAFIGFIVGVRQGVPTYEPPEFAPPDTPAAPNTVAAVAYRDFDRRTHGPNSAWRSSLADLEQPAYDPEEPVHWDEESRRSLQAQRASRRAYDGAPPVVPHPIDQLTTSSCVACHTTGLRIGELRAPAMSHDFMHNCTQCHVEQWSVHMPQIAVAANIFRPLDAPAQGERAWPGAPPTIPHPTFMRDNCMACHGPSGPDPIRTSHPWQVNCLQCHAPSAVLDQGVFDTAPPLLPPLRVVPR